MSSKVTFELLWSEESAIRASKLYYDYDMKNSAKRYIGWLFVALVQFGIVGALKHNSYGILFVATFLVAYWYYGRWYLRAGMIKRFYKKHHSEDELLKIEIDAKKIALNTQVIPWEEVERVIELEEGFILQTLTNTLFFENTLFKKGSDKMEFRRFASEAQKL